MGEAKKLMLAGAGVIIVGFIMVGMSKQQTNEEREAASQIRTLVAMQEMANQKCPKLILNHTGTQVYFPSKTDTDKNTYVTMEWDGEQDANFKHALCTLKLAIGGVSKLVVDDKVLIDK